MQTVRNVFTWKITWIVIISAYYYCCCGQWCYQRASSYTVLVTKNSLQMPKDRKHFPSNCKWWIWQFLKVVIQLYLCLEMLRADWEEKLDQREERDWTKWLQSQILTPLCPVTVTGSWITYKKVQQEKLTFILQAVTQYMFNHLAR